MIEPLVIRLPMPPSLNGSYANVPGKGRVATKALRNWKAAAGSAIAVTAGRHTFAGRVDVSILVPIPANGRNRDGDNCAKPVLDALVAGGVLADDNWRHVRRSSVEWVDDGSLGVECSVTVTQIADAPSEAATGASKGRKRPSPLSAEGRGKTAVTGQRRASDATSADIANLLPKTPQKRPDRTTGRPQRPSPRSQGAASDTAVRSAIASRLGISPDRVHLNGSRMASNSGAVASLAGESRKYETRQQKHKTAV